MKNLLLLLTLAALAPASHHQCRCDVRIRYFLKDKKQETKYLKSGSIVWMTSRIPIILKQNNSGMLYTYDSVIVEVNPVDHWYDKFLKP